MTFEDLRQLADQVRQLPLEAVLAARGAVRDRRDKHKWHTHQGPLSITGAKFMNWRSGAGGGGAIDLAMHLGEPDYRAAVLWLARNLTSNTTTSPHSSRPSSPATPDAHGELKLPTRADRHLQRIRAYLGQQRSLPSDLVDALIDSGRLYADARGNAVFLLVAGKPNRVVGAELRGTGRQVWRGMAPGSKKDTGFFWIGDPNSRTMVLCESAIDAISCHAIARERLAISTAGARPHPGWLSQLLDREYQIYCGFDADQAGNQAAATMLASYPGIRRLCPPAKDWNDVLRTTWTG